MGGDGSIATDVAEVSVDGGGYTTRPLSGSIDVASACGQIHMVSVRVRRGSIVGPNQNGSGAAEPCPDDS